MYKMLLMLVKKILRRVRRKLRRVWQFAAGTVPLHQMAIVILVSDEVHNHMRRIQLGIVDRYGESSGFRSSPHLTLKQGFRGSDIDRFARYLDELVADIEPFDICVKGVSSFDNNILFLDVESNPRLEALRQRVLGDLSGKFGIAPTSFEGDQYHFHATLAYGLAKDAISAELKRLANANIECRFTLDTLALIISTGNGWTTYKLAPLARPLPGRTADELAISSGLRRMEGGGNG
jgi:2'-5' RNA ligase